MPNVYLTDNHLEAIKLALESDIEASECYDPDYTDVWQMSYYMYRAEALHEMNMALMPNDTKHNIKLKGNRVGQVV